MWRLILKISKSNLASKNIPEQPFRDHFYECLRESHKFYQDQATSNKKTRAEEMVKRDEEFKGERMNAYIHRLRGEEKERRLLWIKYADSLTIVPERQKSHLSAVKRADESRQDSVLHSSMKVQQSDQRPWNYKPYTPQQMTRIDQANVKYERVQEECNEKGRKRQQELNKE